MRLFSCRQLNPKCRKAKPEPCALHPAHGNAKKARQKNWRGFSQTRGTNAYCAGAFVDGMAGAFVEAVSGIEGAAASSFLQPLNAPMQTKPDSATNTIIFFIARRFRQIFTR